MVNGLALVGYAIQVGREDEFFPVAMVSKVSATSSKETERPEFEIWFKAMMNRLEELVCENERLKITITTLQVASSLQKTPDLTTRMTNAEGRNPSREA